MFLARIVFIYDNLCSELNLSRNSLKDITLHLSFKLLERIFHSRSAKSDWLLNYPASLERKGGGIIFLALTLL